MPSFVFTETAVKRLNLPSEQERQTLHWDKHLPAFGLRVGFNGAKAWIAEPRVLKLGAWTKSRITLGRYPDMPLAEARSRAREVLAQARQGENVVNIRKADKSKLEEASRNSFGACVADFLAKYPAAAQLREATIREYRRTLEGADLAHWRDMPISQIKAQDIYDVLDRMVERGAEIGANRTLAYLSKFFNWCVSRQRLEDSPARRVEKPAANPKRDRTLSEAEVAEVWQAFDALPYPFGPLFKLLALTGQRRSEVAGMRWSEIEGFGGEAPVWTLPAYRSKNGRPHAVPLSSQVVKILSSLARIAGQDLVFSTTGQTAVSGFGRAKAQADAHIAKKRAEGRRKAIQPWTIHDLRRTAATLLHSAPLNVSPHIVEAVLNHVSGHKAGVAGVYNKAAYLLEKTATLAAWGKRLEGLLQDE